MIDEIAKNTKGTTSKQRTNLDDLEVEKFGSWADEWWLPSGKFQPLHALGPARMAFLKRTLCANFDRTDTSLSPLKGLAVLDIGCGGGLVSEPLARLGASVTGIDPAPENIAAARAHSEAHGLTIDYHATTAEDLQQQNTTFDAVVCLEVVEHVPDVGQFIACCAQLVRPEGTLIASTINRTAKSYALAIVAAEYVLGWVPRGTHQWDRFVTPDEMSSAMTAAGLNAPVFEGMIYDPLRDSWKLGADTDVNYLVAAQRKA